MNHQSDEEDDSNSKTGKSTSHKSSPLSTKPTTSRPIVRKLPDSMKMPFQRSLADHSQPCSSRNLTQNETETKKSPSTGAVSRSYSFNFNAIKSRFADPNEPTKTKKRQFDGTKNDLSPQTTPKGIKPNTVAANSTSQSCSLSSSTDRSHSIQSDSKRQKSDLSESSEVYSGQVVQVVKDHAAEQRPVVEVGASSEVEKKEKFVSVVSTSEPEKIYHQEEMASQRETNQLIETSNSQTPLSVQPMQQSTEASNVSAAYVTTIHVNPPETHTNNSQQMNKSSALMDTASMAVLTNDSDDEVDLSDIRLDETFVKKREEEKAKEADEKLKKEQEANSDNSTATTSSSQDDKTKTPTTSEKSTYEPLTDPNLPNYWDGIFATEFYRQRSLNFADLLNKEFGYAGRMGHGNRNNFFRTHGLLKPRLIYDQQMQSAREYINKALNSLNSVRRMKLAQSLVEHEGCVNALNYNKSGTLLLSGSDDYRVCVWEWASSKPVLQFESGHKSNVFQTKFVPFSGDTQIVTCARDGQVRLALISSSGTHLGTKKLAKHADACHKLSIEHDSSNLFLSCGEDGVVFEIDLRQDAPAKILTVRTHGRNYKLPLYSVHSNPSDTYQFCVVGRDPFIRIYDKRMLVDAPNKMLKQFCPAHQRESERSSITSAVYNHDGTEIIASYSDDDIYLYETNQSKDEEPKYRYSGHRNSDTVKGVNYYGSNSDYIISGSDCGRVFFWEKTTQQIVQVLKDEESGIVNVLEPHPSFPHLATSGLDSDIKIWSPSGEPNKLDNLSEIIRENKRVRETSRHFSLSSFEFELLLLLMHRPNNRVYVGSAVNEELSNRLNAAGVNRVGGETVDASNLFGSYSLRRRRGLLPTGARNILGEFGEEEAREYSPVDDDDNEEQSYDEDEDEDIDFMNFEEEE